MGKSTSKSQYRNARCCRGAGGRVHPGNEPRGDHPSPARRWLRSTRPRSRPATSTWISGGALSQASSLFGLKMYVDDGAALTVTAIRQVLTLKRREGLGLVVVDYLQLMKIHAPSRESPAGDRRHQPFTQELRPRTAGARDRGVPTQPPVGVLGKQGLPASATCASPAPLSRMPTW